MCNFIHSEVHRGSDIPRDDFYRLRAENQQRFQVFLYILNPSLMAMNGISPEQLEMARLTPGFDSYCSALLQNVRLYEQNRQVQAL